MQTPFHVPDITTRKNAGLSHAADYTLEQPYERYGADDQQTWHTLHERQMALLPGRACQEFLDGLDKLQLSAERIPRFDELNTLLSAATSWHIVAVHGLIPDETFFEHLANRRFPVTWWLREPAQLDYLQEPDIFHDLFGHVPLLTNPVFANYLQAYGVGGLRAAHLHALPMLARLYWYTVEFGLMRTPEGLRIYGAGILSSRTESIRCLHDAAPRRIAFDLKRIMCTRYHIDRFQDSYFVIDDFAQLFTATAADFAPYYQELAQCAELAPGEVLPTDLLLSPDPA